MGKTIKDKLVSVQKAEQIILTRKNILLEKAFKSINPGDIIKANEILNNIQNREKQPRKSLIIDPLDFAQGAWGYKDKPYSLTYNTLLRMARTPIINAIIKTRKNQIASFCEPQSDKYSTGFIIRKKRRVGQKVDEKSKEDAKKVKFLTDFLLNCGENYSWEADDFDTFIRKVVYDSLVYDQMTWENIRNNKGRLVSFIATDASTFRIAESYDDDTYYETKRSQLNGNNVSFFDNKQKIKGYYPNYVQVLHNRVEAEFYPWELCFGIRNPSTSVYNLGYGISELEEMINVVTSILYADEYNRRFFSQGSAPKGILRIKGNVPEATLQQFRQQWQAMITGVMNAWKTPVLDQEVEWIDLQKSNKDMEYNHWMEYLIKIACGIYAIDPNEVGFNINNSPGQGAMFESNNEQKLKHSKDKGLIPLLKFIQRKINKFIISQLDPEYEFVFVGMEGDTPAQELDMDVKKGALFTTINELREKYDMKPIGEEGDVISVGVYAQARAAEKQKELMEQQQQQAEEAQAQQQEEESQNPFNNYEALARKSAGKPNKPQESSDEGETNANPFAKAFLDHLNEIEDD